MNGTQRIMTRMGASMTRKANRFAASSRQMFVTFADKFHKTFDGVLMNKSPEQRFIDLQQQLLRLLKQNPNSPKINGILSLAAEQIGKTVAGRPLIPELEGQLQQLQKASPTQRDQEMFKNLKIAVASISTIPGSVMTVFYTKKSVLGGAPEGAESEPTDITVTLVALYVLMFVITIAFFFVGVVITFFSGGLLGEMTMYGFIGLFEAMFPATANDFGIDKKEEGRNSEDDGVKQFGGTKKKRRRNYRLKNNL